MMKIKIINEQKSKEQTKICSACKVAKDIMKFSKCGGGKRRSQCSPCITAKRRNYQKDYHKAYDTRKYYRNNKQKVIFKNLIRRMEKKLTFLPYNPYYKYLHKVRGIERNNYLNSLMFKKRIKKFNNKYYLIILKTKKKQK